MLRPLGLEVDHPIMVHSLYLEMRYTGSAARMSWDSAAVNSFARQWRRPALRHFYGHEPRLS